MFKIWLLLDSNKWRGNFYFVKAYRNFVRWIAAPLQRNLKFLKIFLKMRLQVYICWMVISEGGEDLIHLEEVFVHEFHSLFHYNNLCGWKEEFDLPMSALQLSTGLSAPTIRKAREQLCRMGRIEYRKGSMDHSAVYRLNPLASFGAVSSAKERAIDATAGKDDSERTTQRAYERSNESSHERTVEGTNKEADTRTDERTYERTNERPKETSTESTMESPTESTMESPTESTMESTMESMTESPIESTMESPMERVMERTEEKSDATFLAKPKQDNTRQSISKESVKKGRDGGPGTICRLLPTSGLVCRRNEDENWRRWCEAGTTPNR